MTIPNYDGKHNAPSVFTAEDALEAVSEELPDLPPAVIICFQNEFFEYLVEAYADGEQLLEQGPDRTYRVDEDVAIVGDFGIGSAMTASLVDEKAALGAEVCCILGGAGCLDPSTSRETAIVPTRAIRDEGASYHYLPSGQPVKSSPALRERLVAKMEAADLRVASGPTWTTDAIYRETVPEVEHYTSEGVLTVEMEAAALFASAEYHGLDAAAVFCVGDYVTPDGRDQPNDGLALLPDLFEPTVEALRAHLS